MRSIILVNGRMIEQRGLRQLAHRPAVLFRQQLEDAPLLDRHAFMAELLVELLVNLAVRLGQKIGKVLGDWATAWHGEEPESVSKDRGGLLAFSPAT
jgi:hypothetical protein